MIGSLRPASISAVSAPVTEPEDVPLPAVAEGAADDMEVELGQHTQRAFWNVGCFFLFSVRG
jgi:hypothetical protein